MKTFAEFQKTNGYGEYVACFDCSDDAESIATQLGIIDQCALIHEEASDAVQLISAEPTSKLYRVRFWDAQRFKEAKRVFADRVAFLTTMYDENLAYVWEGDYEELIAMAGR